MKKTLSVLLALVLVLSIACAVSADEKVTLNLWHRWGGATEAAVQEVVDAFEAANPDIEVEVTAKAGEYFELLQSMIADAAAGNKLPDIFIGGYAMLNYIADELNVVTVDKLAPNEEALNEVYARYGDILKVASFKGQQIGLPYALSNMVMWVNMDIWADAGLTEDDIPATYEDLTKCLEQIVEKTGKNGACLATNDNWIDQVLSMSHGGGIITDDLDRVTFNNDAVIGEMTWWQDLYTRGLIPKCTYTEMATMFYAGDVAVYCATIMNESTFREYCTFDYKAWPMPTFEGFEKKLPVGGSALISFTQDPAMYEYTWRMMDFMSSDEAMQIWATKSGYVCPTSAEVPTTVNQDVCLSQFPCCSNYLCWPGGSVGLEIDSIWTNTRNAILHDGLDVAETLAAVDAECNEMLDNA
ncbi:MAG: extracellular solute-binding protein [Clostridiales bacterium]|jgi:multiple sugar transport system substrate-binding protein|nr:extracellular solute-binding protein [Bacillota bacterium]NLL54720.1 extracellular solute-binding protein [Clostridiales bacterium]